VKLYFIFLLVFLSLPALANRKGLGISIGNPTGLNGKYWLDNKSAVDAGVAYSLGKKSNFSLHSDYLLHKEGAFFFNDVHPLDLYYGLGARMEFDHDIEVGVRIPVGLSHTVENGSADMFAEVAPIVDLVTKTGLEIHLLFGARYYF
jgi:hypothetical protein